MNADQDRFATTAELIVYLMIIAGREKRHVIYFVVGSLTSMLREQVVD